jgi:hypothetical protein
MNGAPDPRPRIFGDRGRVRKIVAVVHFPLDALCEVEAIFEIAP